MDVLVTGAFGRAGTAILDALGQESRYRFRCLDREVPPDGYTEYETVTGDIADYPAIEDAFEGIDAVVHLAALPGSGPWPAIRENNIEGTRNVLEAVDRHGIECVVFASTNHVVGGYEDEHAPALYEEGYDLTIDHHSPRRPDSNYGVSKSFGEDYGRFAVEYRTAPDRFYALRIGNLRPAGRDSPYARPEQAVANGEYERGGPTYEERVNRYKAVWCSRRDFAHLVDCCLQDETVTFDVFYGISNNTRRWFDLEHARTMIGYEPADDGEAVEAPEH